MDLQHQRVTQHIKERYGSKPEYLWANYPDNRVFRHPASQKWYAVISVVPRDRLGLNGNEAVSVLNVKCSPLMLGSLLREKGFLPAYHMNKSTWISILLDETVSDDSIFFLLECSYDSVAPKRRKPSLRHPQ